MVMLFDCQMCDPPKEWLGKSAPTEFRMSAPQQGWCVCENCVERELYEEPFEKTHWATLETTKLHQPKSFSYVSYATTDKPGGPWTEIIPDGTRWPTKRNRPGRSEHCRRVLRITIPCCLEGCESEEAVVHLTENTVRKWGAGPLRVWEDDGSLWYESAYYECCGIEHSPDNGDEVEEWADRFCEAGGHECESCKDWFENKLYTSDPPRELKKAYLAMKADPSDWKNRQEYEGLAGYRRQRKHTQKPQIEATTSILDAFLGEDPTGCVRSGLTVGPPNTGYGSSDERCGFQLKRRDVEIPLLDSMGGGRFIGNGYMCDKHD